MEITRRKSNWFKYALAVGAALTLLALPACSGSNADPVTTVHCVDGNNTIVDDDKCDDDRSSGFFFLAVPGGDTHRPGHRYTNLPQGHQRVATNDQAGRSRIGLPGTGKVSTGTQYGGIGKGSVGSGNSNGGGNNSKGS